MILQLQAPAAAPPATTGGGGMMLDPQCIEGLKGFNILAKYHHSKVRFDGLYGIWHGYRRGMLHDASGICCLFQS